MKPTPSVIKVCEETEKVLQRKLIITNGKLPTGKGVVDDIVHSVFNHLCYSNIFSDLNEHALEVSLGEDYHIFLLIKTISKCYCIIRFHKLAILDKSLIK